MLRMMNCGDLDLSSRLEKRDDRRDARSKQLGHRWPHVLMYLRRAQLRGQDRGSRERKTGLYTTPSFAVSRGESIRPQK